MPKKKEPSSSLTLFKEMCDLMFEIAEKDDDCQNNKSNYLNKHIAKWIYPKEKQYSKRINSTSRQCTHTLPPPPPAPRAPKVPPGPFCYRCALPLYPGHSEHCEGVHATCRYCNTKGHVKAACGKLENLPQKNYNSKRVSRWSPVEEKDCNPKAKCIGHNMCYIELIACSCV